MKKLSRWMILLGIILVFVALSAFTVPVESSSPDVRENPVWASFHDEVSEASFSLTGEFPPPSPNQNPCLHCHIAGSEEGPWTPLYRWISFGTMGLIFAFGMIRSLSTWKTRERWKSVGARVSELVNTTDPLAKTLDEPAPTWKRRAWYYLGGLLGIFLVIQIITGAVNAYHMDPLLFDPEIDTHARFILNIRNLHWGIGVVLLLTMLGFTLIGTLLNSGQRSFWATMLIIACVFGIPAIIQLTLAFLDPEQSLQASQLFALHTVLISSLIASIVGMFFIVTHTNKPSDG